MQNLKIKIFSYKLLPIIGVVLIIPAIWALFVPGYYGASDDIHIGWLFEFHRSLMSGQIPPRFVPDLSYQFGYPLFNFVFPLPFYIAEIFHLLGLSLVDSIKSLFLITVPISGFFMYKLLREYTNRGLSLVGAILYVYTPYRATDLYVRGAIGEIISFAIMPAILLSLIKLYKTLNFRWVGIGGISLAMLVLSHDIAAYMFFPFLGLLVILQLIFHPKKWEFFKKAFLSLSLGLLISCYFWLPALLESSLMKYDTVFNFADHFPTLKQLFVPFWGYGASVPGPFDGMSFFFGTANILIMVLGLISLGLFWKKFSKEEKIISVWALICLISALFLMNFRSVFLWSNLPFLPYFQFPWRFLILTTLVFPIFVIFLKKIPYNRYLTLALLILVLITSYFDFRPQDFLGRTDDYFLNRYIPYPKASLDYTKTQEEYLRLPKDTTIRPDKIYPLVEGIGIKKVFEVNSFDTIIQTESTMSGILNYNKYLYPGWQARIDGNLVNLEAGKPFGQITLQVPPGSHNIEIKFVETAFKKILDAISLLAFLVSLMLSKLWIKSKKAGRLSWG